MLRLTALAAPLVLTGLLAAQPAPQVPPPPPPTIPAFPALDEPDSLAFARRLVMLCDQVSGLYVRPVPAVELTHAALLGLYDAARLPAPPDLADRLRRAGERERIEAVRKAREDIGDSPYLRDRDPLVPCCKALARALDPYTEVVTAEEQRKLIGLEQEAGGVGVELEDVVEGGPLAIRTVLPGGPAQRAGLRPGDRIEHVEPRPCCPGSVAQWVDWLTAGPDNDVLPPGRPPEPASLLLGCRRGDQAWEVALDRRRFRVETVLGVSRQDDHCWSTSWTGRGASPTSGWRRCRPARRRNCGGWSSTWKITGCAVSCWTCAGAQAAT